MFKTEKLAAVIALAAVAGCAPLDWDVRVARGLASSETPFQDFLAQEYGLLTTNETSEVDKTDGPWFMDRTSEPGSGNDVAPESLSNRDIPADKYDELAAARADLENALNGGARDSLPETAAHAQAMFDCWISEQGENKQPDDVSVCKNEFLRAMNLLSPREVAAVAPIVPEPLPEPPPPVQSELLAGPYNVYFDLDKSTLDDLAHEALKEAVAAHQQFGDAKIYVRGYTDRKGSSAYNEALSRRRAAAVVEALKQMGIPAEVLHMEAYGEERPKVPTGDGKKLRTNRRVEIWLNS